MMDLDFNAYPIKGNLKRLLEDKSSKRKRE